MENKKCAPSKKYTNDSCFSIESLKIIGDKYNKTHEDKININNSKEELVKELKEKFFGLCKEEQNCWLDIPMIKKLNDYEIQNNTFRPLGPKKKYEWLSTNHINDVISQYHEKYKDFIFFGAVPYDFEELSILGFQNINFDNLSNMNFFEKNDNYDSVKKTKFGLIINLDEHDQSGSHWVALYADLIKNQIYFFDSFGKPPRKKIRKFINKILKFLYKKKFNSQLDIKNVLSKNDLYSKNIIKNFNIKYNDIQHQFENSECGVYSINFILRLLKGESFENIINNITKDEEMNDCRNKYYRKKN